MDIKSTVLSSAVFFMSLAATAEEPKVEITSFRFAGSRTLAAELCGNIVGVTAFPAFVRVTVDEKTDKPGIYNVVVGPEAKFCVSVVTYRGTAIADLWGKTSEPATGLFATPRQER